MQEQVQVTFTGPSMANVAGQAAAFGRLANASVNETAGEARARKPKTTAVAAAVEENEELSALENTDETEELNGLDAEAGEEGENELVDFDEIADEPANAKSTPAKNKAAAAAAAAKPKTKKYTIKDVNAALVNYMKVAKKSKADTQKLLKKFFKVETATELKESDYAKVIEAVTPKA